MRQGEMDEREGGDPACWAHLLDEEVVCAAGSPVTDLLALLGPEARPGVNWAVQSDDLNVNLLVFAQGDGVAEHVNAEVDVLLVAIAGAGEVIIGAERVDLRAGSTLLIPKGVPRAIVSRAAQFAYLSCHRRRTGLWPAISRKDTN